MESDGFATNNINDDGLWCIAFGMDGECLCASFHAGKMIEAVTIGNGFFVVASGGDGNAFEGRAGRIVFDNAFYTVARSVVCSAINAC